MTTLTASFSSLKTHTDAILLAVASSTDNFMVGITAGLASSSSSNNFYKVNIVVALCNASGTLFAVHGGDMLKLMQEKILMRLAAAVSSSSSPETYELNVTVGALLAGAAFAYLAWKEYNFDQDGKEVSSVNGDNDDKKKKAKLSYSIALPMTLNNLAGGVAGGALGVSIFQATLWAFLVSCGSMALGHSLSSRLLMLQKRNANHSQEEKKSATARWCKLVAVTIYVLLAIQSLSEVQCHV